MKFTHFNEFGRAHMVDISLNDDKKRIGIARGRIRMKRETIEKIKEGITKKGDVLSVAQIAGIMGAKKTSEIIPMCHNVSLSGADIRFCIFEDHIELESEIRTIGKIGVEMEALTAVSVACLTIYDMCKSIDKEMVIENIKVIKKTGGDSCEYLCKGLRGKVLSINISDKKGVIKTPITEGIFIENFGLEKDAHSGGCNRQVSLLGMESFKRMEEKGVGNLFPGIFAENITTEGIILYELPVGTKLVIGETLQEVTQVGKRCTTRCEVPQKVGQCIMPEEGIFTKVIKGGLIKEGDIIEII